MNGAGQSVVEKEVSRMKIRKQLSAGGLFGLVRTGFEKISDHRCIEMVEIPLGDAMMSAFAMFSLKDPSLLAFDARREQKDGNLERIYGIEQVPCDTQMRTILDEVDPAEVKPVYKDVFRAIQRGKGLEAYVFMDQYYLLSLDGTGYFSSKKIHCASCLEKQNAQTGEVTYHHQLMGGAIVHPDQPAVIPLAPEPIVKQDGETKNDCERNAAKRFVAQFRQDHPHLEVIVLEDALSPNAPHIRELERHKLHYILNVKAGDHAFLFDYVATAHQQGKMTEVEDHGLGGVVHRYRFLNQVPLNASNQDVLVNFVAYWQIKDDVIIKRFHKVTDLTVTTANVRQIMRGGRAYWKIENETFNTLKNQGYQFEHNFGHGQTHLSVVFALLMLLAFLVDQTQQIACRLFQAVLAKEGSRRALWDHMRALFFSLPFNAMEDIYRALLYGYQVQGVLILDGH
jgi:hypothetical protein